MWLSSRTLISSMHEVLCSIPNTAKNPTTKQNKKNKTKKNKTKQKIHKCGLVHSVFASHGFRYSIHMACATWACHPGSGGHGVWAPKAEGLLGTVLQILFPFRQDFSMWPWVAWLPTSTSCAKTKAVLHCSWLRTWVLSVCFILFEGL